MTNGEKTGKIKRMKAQLKTLATEALKLTHDERVEFVQLLQASLSEDAGLDDVWATEAERRIAAIESGTEQVIPISEVLAQVRGNLK